MKMQMGDRIKKLRMEKKWKQSDLAEKAGISREAVGNYENNRRQPPVDIASRIAAALGVSADYLINGVDAPMAADPDERPATAEEIEALLRKTLGNIPPELLTPATAYRLIGVFKDLVDDVMENKGNPSDNTKKEE